MRTDRTHRDGSDGSGGLEALTRDFQALRDATERDLPDIHQTIHHAAQRLEVRDVSREGILMTTIERITNRPWWATAAVASAIAIVLLFVPVSYERTLGQEVSISLTGDLAGDAVPVIADAFRAAMGVPQIRLEVGETTTLAARLPGRSRAEASAMGRAFASRLEPKGIRATTAVSPWTEKISGNVYAQVGSRWRDLRVETQGRSEAQVEKEVQAQLQQLGFLNPEVTFRREGDTTKLGIKAGGPDDEIQAKLERKVTGGNGQEPPIEMGLPDFSDLDGLPDDQIKAEVEKRLRERGLEAEVQVQNGKIQVKVRKEVRQ